MSGERHSDSTFEGTVALVYAPFFLVAKTIRETREKVFATNKILRCNEIYAFCHAFAA